MIKIVLNGREVTATKGEYLLGVAKREGIDIPALCHHESVEPAGSCRLCMVEITKKEWNGYSKTVTSCLYPAEDGLIVKTNTEKVRHLRKEVLELLVARSPHSDVIQNLANEYGIIEPKYTVDQNGDNCILCGICTRVCQELVTGAISTVYRGVEKKVSTPFSDISDACIGCLACVNSCPTNAIPFERQGTKLEVWGKNFELIPCKVCGAPTVTAEHAQWLAKRTGMDEEDFYVCDKCKTAKTGSIYKKIMW